MTPAAAPVELIEVDCEGCEEVVGYVSSRWLKQDEYPAAILCMECGDKFYEAEEQKAVFVALAVDDEIWAGIKAGRKSAREGVVAAEAVARKLGLTYPYVRSCWAEHGWKYGGEREGSPSQKEKEAKS